ncbi:uncharacterized protein ELE39_000307 [Cryptosporidium sp. chipmunk genotype I]|uniref:uncharacterized protein n=1 Tax=Cryptosporidium sp. chipmunk genotype I TaxID=1280935 RepID=UPI00351A6038|nr:hypothetical protein ELE39_000307 [Cryptosporidium sp. chipmunk genotype I]
MFLNKQFSLKQHFQFFILIGLVVNLSFDGNQILFGNHHIISLVRLQASANSHGKCQVRAGSGSGCEQTKEHLEAKAPHSPPLQGGSHASTPKPRCGKPCFQIISVVDCGTKSKNENGKTNKRRRKLRSKNSKCGVNKHFPVCKLAANDSGNEADCEDND